MYTLEEVHMEPESHWFVEEKSSSWSMPAARFHVGPMHGGLLGSKTQGSWKLTT